MLRILIVDDHPMIRENVQTALKEASDIELVGEGTCGADFERLVPELQPDIVLLDLNMPQIPGKRTTKNNFNPMAALAWCKQHYPQVRVVILSQQTNPLLLEEMKKGEGVAGYLLKEDALGKSLISMLRSVAAGQVVVSPSVDENLNACPLNKRQVEVLQTVAFHPDRTYAEYADMLSITESVFRKHLSKIYAALEVENLREAILKASFEEYIVVAPKDSTKEDA